MPAFAAAGSARRLVLLPREPRASRRPGTPEPGPHHRPARPERTELARAERFAHLKRQYD